MRQKIFFIGILFLLVFVFNNFTKEDDWPVLKGPYLGQKPPGMTPEIFAYGIISTKNLDAASGAFTKDGKMFIFKRRRPSEEYLTVYLTELKNGLWTKPSPAPFNSNYADWDYNFAPDGSTFYFTSKRPVRNGDKPSRYGHIWVTQFTNSGWTAPHILEYPINNPNSHSINPTLTKDGTIYFFSNRKGGFGKSDIYHSRLENEEYKVVKNLGSPVNSEFSDYDSFIAPDESYLIFSSDRPGGYGKYNDIYITFRKKDGTWTEPKNLGYDFRDSGINCVTLDNKYLFFTCDRSGKNDIYWVDAKIIEEFKPKELK